MVLLFYVDGCLMFSTSKDKMDELYASIQGYFKIEDEGELNKYLGKDLYLLPYGSIHISQPDLTQIIPKMIPGMEKSSAKPKPTVKPILEKNEGVQARKMYLITYE